MRRERITRRGLLQAFTTGVAGLLVAACTPKAAPAPAPEQPTVASVGTTPAPKATAVPAAKGVVSIRFASHGDWAWLMVWMALIDGFNKEHEGKIVVSFEHSTGDIWAKYMTQMAAGTAADVIRWEDKRTPEWMERGEQLLDLTPYYETTGKIKAEDYFEVLWKDCWYKGKLVQLPHDCSPVTLWYNTKLFKERGVKPPPKVWDDPTWTWDAYLETCRQLTFGEGPKKVFGTYGSRWWVYTHPWVWSNGGEIITYPDNQVKIDMEQTIEAWQFLADLPNKHKVQPMPDQATEGGSTLFESGRTAFYIDNGSYSERAVLVAKDKGFEWDLAPIPSHNGKPVFTRCPNNTIACYRGTKHPDEAFTFAAFMASAKAMERTRAVPSHKEVALGKYLSRTKEHNWKVQVDALTKYLKIEPRTPYFEEANTALDNGWHEVLDGVKEAKVAVRELKPKLEAILKGKG